jgi:hypothetical protein
MVYRIPLYSIVGEFGLKSKAKQMPRGPKGGKRPADGTMRTDQTRSTATRLTPQPLAASTPINEGS